MPFLRTVFAGWMILALLSPASGQLNQPAPPVHGTLLRGGSVTLPDDLHGAPAVLVIGFTEGSRDEVSAWGKRLATAYTAPASTRGAGTVRWFEVAELESVPRFLRGWLTKKIRETVSVRGQATFLIVTDHEKEWKQAVGFNVADQAYVAVVDGGGVVRGIAYGPVSDAALLRVETIVSGLQHGGQ